MMIVLTTTWLKPHRFNWARLNEAAPNHGESA